MHCTINQSVCCIKQKTKEEKRNKRYVCTATRAEIRLPISMCGQLWSATMNGWIDQLLIYFRIALQISHLFPSILFSASFLPSRSVGRSDRDIIRSGTRRTGVSNILCRMCHLIWSKTNKLYIMQQQEELLDAAEMEFGSFWFQSIDNGRHLTCCFLSAVMGRTAESSWAEHSSAHDDDPSTPSIPMRIVNLNRLLWVAGWMQGWEGIHKRHVILCPTRSDQVRSRFIEQQQQLHADSFNHFLFREKDRRRRAVFFLSYLIILFRTWTDGAVCWEGE